MIQLHSLVIQSWKEGLERDEITEGDMPAGSRTTEAETLLLTFTGCSFTEGRRVGQEVLIASNVLYNKYCICLKCCLGNTRYNKS